MRFRSASFVLALALMPAFVSGKDLRVIVSAPNRDYVDTPVQVPLQNPPPGSRFDLVSGKLRIPAQVVRENGKDFLVWIERDLKKGQKREYKLEPSLLPEDATTMVEAKQSDSGDLALYVGGSLFAKYDTKTGPNKPYFYPVYGARGERIVRGHPLEKFPGEELDHPHHRGLWYTHGEVNGADYWSEMERAGKTVHTNYSEAVSGAAMAGFTAETDWIAPGGKLALQDTRRVRVYSITGGRMMDFDITLRAVAGPVILGDTKEGSFGIRVHESMRAKANSHGVGSGHILSSTGLKDATTWGKKAAWVDYYGPVDGHVSGIAIFDHPSNLRHPTTWHVRDYGLFAVNPFGLHDFEPGQKKGIGDHTIPAGESLTFRYRLLFHVGDSEWAKVSQVWDAYADPPVVEVR